MNVALVVISFVLLGTAAVAMVLRDLVRSALLLVVSWFALAALYLWAGAEFIAFAQVLVYAGGISMVVLFAVLLTQRSRLDLLLPPDSRRRTVSAVITGAAVAGVLVYAILASSLPSASTAPPTVTVL